MSNDLNKCEAAGVIRLHGEWHLSSLDKSVQTIASVPVPLKGQVHLDLIRAEILQEDPYYGTNYVKDSMRKIIGTTWVFEKEILVEENLDHRIGILDCEGLDTVATVFLNNILIGSTNNQFRRYMFDVSTTLRTGSNILHIQFESAVSYANTKAKEYPYYVPDMFNMSSAQHGFPCRNFIRKEQVSVEISSVKAQTLSTVFKFDGGLPTSESTFSVNTGESTFNHSIFLKKSQVKLWWPRNYGQSTTYTLEVTLVNESGSNIASHVFQCGFRTCELIQDTLVQGEPGSAFKFRVNGMDVFAKGSNWIPGHVFDKQMTTEKKRSLLESCVAANMNQLRVWGGGIYETDEFYQMCDELGIMVWQEFMFACALYPTNKEFLDNVKLEVSDQVRRLMIHPCIVLWSGNNENQEFMVKGYAKEVDYYKLYVDTIMSTLQTLDISRPFISTSPSAGLISTTPYTERYVLKDNERGLYGDVHFYDYRHNGLHVEYYPNSRFVSEYGAQSMCSYSSWKTISSPDDWHPLSKFSVHRNHHGNGQREMLEQIEYQFQLPNNLSKYYHSDPESLSNVPVQQRGNLFDVFCYLTQCVQARSITAQTEHYNNYDMKIPGYVPIEGYMIVRSYKIDDNQFETGSSIPFSVDGHSSKYLSQVKGDLLGDGSGDNSPRLLFATATVVTGGRKEVFEMLPQTFPTRDAFPLNCLEIDPRVSIDEFSVEKGPSSEGYRVFITLRSSALAGMVWLEWSESKMEGYFEENAFWLLPQEPKRVIYYGWDNIDIIRIEEDLLGIKSLASALRCSP
ncbi:hypothetical protein BGX21_007490 [Mortierella sp. AD011]|nr:hypothetical protein BGX21_007490 [Mortierella sp. AD011]